MINYNILTLSLEDEVMEILKEFKERHPRTKYHIATPLMLKHYEVIENAIHCKLRIQVRVKGLKVALERRKDEESKLGKGDQSYRLFLLERIASLHNEIALLEPYLDNKIVQESRK